MVALTDEHQLLHDQGVKVWNCVISQKAPKLVFTQSKVKSMSEILTKTIQECLILFSLLCLCRQNNLNFLVLSIVNLIVYKKINERLLREHLSH